ncbi:hypothetical protein P280DRAFT_464494 [Massarina eburnea CBS 473.64]|uniref:Uncharacterized protein n=1 Tax=Massarina eburnea CBS 473.64 TaxID=1395130 RepID=A0A6A6SEJ8_9PLEO|nr:hypothetical protein P280DRAFT_464494 [Massarina eburnea CBS 473.64]
MSFDRDILFGDTSFESCPEACSANCSSSVSTISVSNDQGRSDRVPTYDDLDDLGEVLGVMQQLLTKDKIDELMGEREKWKVHVDESAKRIAVLEKRVGSKPAIGVPTDPDLVARLNHLERENRHLVSENLRLKQEIQDTERKNTLLCNDNEGKSRKLRGANKKVKKAKDVAVNEEEKAKEAAHERDHRLRQQREQRKMMKSAQAEAASQKKLIQKLQSQLDAEKSGAPHLRDHGSTTDETTAAFSVSIKINRRHFLLIRSMLADSQTTVTSRINEWYEKWKDSREAKQTIGATYNDTPDTGSCVDMNAGLVEVLGRYEEYSQTGAEHDGRRSRRDLEAIVCRTMDAITTQVEE